MYTKAELKVLDRLSLALHGCRFEELDTEEQDALYCYAEDNELFEE